MGHYTGRVVEILLEPYQNAAARIAIPHAAVPKPGQYLQAHDPQNPLEVIATSLFAAGAPTPISSDEISLPVSGPLPASWQPGTQLRLRAPLGRGFELPPRAKRIALAVLAGSPARLLALLPAAEKQRAEISLFCNAPVGELPLSMEVGGLDALPEALPWADYLAVSVSIEQLDELQTHLKKSPPRSLPAQALVMAPMPCGGLAKCGVCSIATQTGSKLVCEDGPVFELKELLN